MPSRSHNISKQEESIKSRSNALFVEDEQPLSSTQPTKPFPTYLRETPAQPFSPLTKAIFLALAFVVALLFVAALWRMSHRPRAKVPADPAPAEDTASRFAPDFRFLKG